MSWTDLVYTTADLISDSFAAIEKLNWTMNWILFFTGIGFFIWWMFRLQREINKARREGTYV